MNIKPIQQPLPPSAPDSESVPAWSLNIFRIDNMMYKKIKYVLTALIINEGKRKGVKFTLTISDNISMFMYTCKYLFNSLGDL